MPASTPTAPLVHGFRLRGAAGDHGGELRALREVERLVSKRSPGSARTGSPGRRFDETEPAEPPRSSLADRGPLLHYAFVDT